MSQAFTVRIEGLKELDKALGELPKATGKNVLRRILRKRAEPIAMDAASKAPVDNADLGNSISFGSRLSRRQRALHRKMMSSSAVEMFVGAGTNPQAITQEFGTWFHDPQPFMRPAWDAHKGQLLDHFAEDLWNEISKSAERLARKRAKAAAGG